MVRTTIARALLLVALVHAPAHARRAMPPCVTPGPLVAFDFDGMMVYFCTPTKQCFTVSIDGAILARAFPLRSMELPVHVTVGGGTQVKVDGNALAICRADGACSTFAVAHAGRTLDAIANDAGTLAAALVARERGAEVVMYDVTAGKPIATFAAGTKARPIVAIEFLGDTLMVRERGGDDERAWLASKTGALIAVVGGRALATRRTWPVHVERALWAFGSPSAVVVQDVVTGELAKTIALDAPPTVQMVGDAHHLVLVSETAEMVVVDLDAGTVARYQLASCERP
jgi:hypothetical protein